MWYVPAEFIKKFKVTVTGNQTPHPLHPYHVIEVEKPDFALAHRANEEAGGPQPSTRSEESAISFSHLHLATVRAKG